jgi:hypothetical protein
VKKYFKIPRWRTLPVYLYLGKYASYEKGLQTKSALFDEMLMKAKFQKFWIAATYGLPISWELCIPQRKSFRKRSAPNDGIGVKNFFSNIQNNGHPANTK